MYFRDIFLFVCFFGLPTQDPENYSPHAGDALKTLDPAHFGKWNSYLALKAAFYESYVS